MNKIFSILSVAVLALTGCAQHSSHEVKILAHRGNASTGSEFTTDENTLDALRRAQALDFAGIEFDVHITADNQLVIHHDNKIAPGLSCQGSTFDEIRAHRLPFGHQIPTLREWLVEAKKTPHIKQLLEIKSHKAEGREAELIAMSLDIIRELDMVDQMYMLSFKTETLDEVLRQEPNMRVVYNSSSLHKSLPPAEVKARGYHAASYNVNVILNHTEWIDEFHSYGIETFLWMVNTPYLYNLAKEWGFTWATTDFYDAITAEE
jgi:glycerophosphoryl diester phosphodiesterase